MNKQHSRSGFTLVELLVVVAIIGILATMLYGPIAGAIQNAETTTIMNNMRSIAQSYFQVTATKGKTVTGTSVALWAKDLATKGGVSDSSMWFGGNYQPKDTATLPKSVKDAAFAGFNDDIAFNVVRDLPKTLSNPGFVPVIWSRGLKLGTGELTGTFVSGKNGDDKIALVGFADGSVIDLNKNYSATPFVKYNSTEAAALPKDALPTGATPVIQD